MRKDGTSAQPSTLSPPFSRRTLFSLIHFLQKWWGSEAGGKEVLRLAVPMIISAGSFAIMQFADRIFLTWFNQEAMDAAFIAGQLVWLLAAFPFSIAAYVNAFVSQYNGAKEWNRIGPIVWQGVWIGFIFLPLVFLGLPLYERFFQTFDNNPAQTALKQAYLFHSLWGLGAMIANESLAAFFSGRKRMDIVMSVNFLAVLLNIILDYAFIFGIRGHFQWGIAGAAIATSLSQWVRFVVFLSLIIIEERRFQGCFHLWAGCRFDKKALKNLLTFGGMGGLQTFFETFSFAFVVFLIGMIGAKETSASAIAFNLNGLTFLPILGTGIAVVTMVGNYIGEGRPHLAKKAALSAIGLGSLIAGFFVILFLFFPNVLLYLYALQNPEEFEPIRALTVVILRFIAFYLFFDAIGVIFCSALKGAGDTRFIMILTLTEIPFLLLPIWIGIRYYHRGIYWIWSVTTLWIFMVGLIYALRFLSGRWLNISLLSPSAPLSNKQFFLEGEKELKTGSKG